MAYSLDVAQLLVTQLSKFTTSNRYQLAGQVANLDFWLDELAHAYAILDGYNQRFERLKKAQRDHVGANRTREFHFLDPKFTEAAPAPPKRIPHTEINNTRRALRDAAHHFLVRCFREGMIDEPRLRESGKRFDITIEAADLKGRV